MVLEDIIHAKSAERQPLYILPLAFIYASVALFVALWIFPSSAAIVAVFLVTIATMPLFLDVVVFEKQKEETSRGYFRELLTFGRGVNKEKLLPFFIYLFLGLSLAVAFWFTVLPSSMLNDLFHVQLNTIKEINLSLTSGNAVFSSFFSAILANNIKVLAFSVLFSFIYGAGAMFILAWNASVIGVAIGDTIRSSVAAASKILGPAGFVTYTSAISVGLFRYLIHGVPEILAYFIGALAGGMLSIAIVRQEFETEKFRKTATDIAYLIGLAALLLVIAALIEVTVSPLVH